VAFAELALLFVLQAFAVLRRRNSVTVRLVDLPDRLCATRFLAAGVCRGLHRRRTLLLPLIALE